MMNRIFVVLKMMALVVAFNAFADVPYYPLSFPRDHAGHFSNTPYAQPPEFLEWWYLSGNATSVTGHELGYTLMYFARRFPHPSGISIEVYWNIMSVTDITNNKFYFMVPTPVNTASAVVSAQTLDINYADTFLLKRNPAGLITAKGKGTALTGEVMEMDLWLRPEEAPILHGNGQGIIDMADGGNSYYYSLPRSKTYGSIKVDGANYLLRPNKSQTWLDHQWGDFLPNVQFGWEWFAIRLKNGTDVMIFANIDKTTHAVLSGGVSIRLPNGQMVYETLTSAFSFQKSNLWVSPLTGVTFPLTHKFSLPSVHLELEVNASISNQDIGGAYEGMGLVQGTYYGHPVKGDASIELLY